MKVPLYALAAAAVVAATLAAPPAAADPAPGFRAETAPWFWSRSGLEAVSATGPSDIWAVGYQGYQAWDWSWPGMGAGTVQLVPPKAAMARWNGTRWHGYDPPDFGGDGRVLEVDAATPQDAWITGRLREGTDNVGQYIGRWDGTRWTKVAPPENAWPTDPEADADGAWFTYSGDLYRWEGGGWTRHDTGEHWITDVAAVSPDDAWAASTKGMLRWDGQAWSAVPEFDGTDLRGIVASEDGAYALGYRKVDDRRVRFGLRWDGTSWTEIAQPPASGLVMGGTGDLWAAGLYGSRMHHFDGTSWTEMRVPVPSGAVWPEIRGATGVPGSAAMWVVGRTRDAPLVFTNR